MVYFIKGGVGDLIGFTNSDYAGDIEDSKSTPGWVYDEWRSSSLVFL